MNIHIARTRRFHSKTNTYTLDTSHGLVYICMYMTTLRQKKVAHEIVNDFKTGNVRSAAEVLESVGYGTGLQNSPKRVLESEGVKNEFERLGFDEDKAKEVVGQILTSEDEEAKDRLKAAEMIFKVFGSFAPEKRVNLNIQENEISPKVQEFARKLNYGITD